MTAKRIRIIRLVFTVLMVMLIVSINEMSGLVLAAGGAMALGIVGLTAWEKSAPGYKPESPFLYLSVMVVALYLWLLSIINMVFIIPLQSAAALVVLDLIGLLGLALLIWLMLVLRRKHSAAGET